MRQIDILTLSRFPLCPRGIALRKVRIPTSPDKVRISTLRRTIQELYRFSLCAEHIYLLLDNLNPLTLFIIVLSSQMFIALFSTITPMSNTKMYIFHHNYYKSLHRFGSPLRPVFKSHSIPFLQSPVQGL